MKKRPNLFAIDYWLTKYPLEIAEQKLSEFKQKHKDLNSRRPNSFSREYLRLKGLTESEIDEHISDRINRSKNANVKLGHFVGDKNPLSRSRSGNEAIAKRIEKSHKTAKENGSFIGDKNPASRLSHTRRGTTVEERIHSHPKFWMKQGYSEETAKQLATESADNSSLNSYIKRYGEETGAAKYADRIILQRAAWNPAFTGGWSSYNGSLQARKFFIKLYRKLRRLGVQRSSVQFAGNPKEYWIKTSDTVYFYDFVLHHEKIIIEFNGIHVHPSPLLDANRRDAWRHAYNKKTADEIQTYDDLKNAAARDKGYTILYVWSNEPELMALKRINESVKNENLETKC